MSLPIITNAVIARQNQPYQLPKESTPKRLTMPHYTSAPGVHLPLQAHHLPIPLPRNECQPSSSQTIDPASFSHVAASWTISNRMTVAQLEELIGCINRLVQYHLMTVGPAPGDPLRANFEYQWMDLREMALRPIEFLLEQINVSDDRNVKDRNKGKGKAAVHTQCQSEDGYDGNDSEDDL